MRYNYRIGESVEAVESARGNRERFFISEEPLDEPLEAADVGASATAARRVDDYDFSLTSRATRVRTAAACAAAACAVCACVAARSSCAPAATAAAASTKIQAIKVGIA
jgi:hypothetical protein